MPTTISDGLWGGERLPPFSQSWPVLRGRGRGQSGTHVLRASIGGPHRQVTSGQRQFREPLDAQRELGDSNPRSLAGRSLSRCSVGRPWGALVLVSGPAAFTLVQRGGIGLWSALMSTGVVRRHR